MSENDDEIINEKKYDWCNERDSYVGPTRVRWVCLDRESRALWLEVVA